MSRSILVAAALALGTISCGPPAPPVYGGAGGEAVGPDGKPAWVDGRSTRYAEAMYLTGTGRGQTRGQCDDDAYAAIAKIFNAQINQVSSDWQGHFSRVSNLGPGVKIEAMSISQLTRVSTDKVLKGARIADHWAGPDTHHCLGVLEREPAAQSLREEIGRLDGEILAQVQRGDSAATPTAKFMAYGRAMEVLQEREALNVDLRIVNPQGAGVPAPIDFPALVAKFTASKSAAKVGLKLTGSKAPQIQSCLAEELTKQGMEVLENTSDVDVMIHGTLKDEKAGVINGSEMVRAEINLRLTDAENGRTLAAFSDYVKVGRPTLAQSVQLAVVQLCQQVVPKLAQQLRASFAK